jgi:hypothetical protein
LREKGGMPRAKGGGEREERSPKLQDSQRRNGGPFLRNFIGYFFLQILELDETFVQIIKEEDNGI